ncbi:hypothetical protein FRC08_013920 [Ceratobasidium sp. 394]|nr:hypothetical protein FRC08_013920 [Ceratobasidium sp. 394]
MGCRFACGKCLDQTATDWSGIIGHYLEEQRRYKFANMGTSNLSEMNRHRLADATIRVVPPEEAGEAPDLAELVPSPKPLHGGRKYHWTMDHGD